MRWSVLLLFIFLLNAVSGISTTLAPIYQPGETIIIKIEGNILQPIQPSDVLFKRAHVAVAVNYDIKKIGDNYYLYAQAPTNKNNYTLFINDIATTINGVITSLDFNQSFSIDGNITDYSVSPGFVITNQNKMDFTINLNLDQPISISTNFPDEHSVNLNPGANTISLSTEGKVSGFYEIILGKYNIPIQITGSQTNQTQTKNNNLILTPTTINRVILANSPYSFNISITNNGSSNMENLKFSFNDAIFNITPNLIISITPQETKEITISLLKLSGSSLQEEIIIYDASDKLVSLKLNMSFTDDENKTSPVIDSNLKYYCSELNGIFCASNEVCSSDTIPSIDGLCCTSTCTVKEESSFGWIGYVSILTIILILIFVYFKYKKAKVPQLKPSSINPMQLKPLQKTTSS